MGVVAKILTALAAALPAIVEWWAKRKAAQDKASVEARNADIRADPGAAWMHKFGAADQQPGGTTLPIRPVLNSLKIMDEGGIMMDKHDAAELLLYIEALERAAGMVRQ